MYDNLEEFETNGSIVIPAHVWEKANQQVQDTIKACKEIEHPAENGDISYAFLNGAKYSGIPFSNELWETAYKMTAYMMPGSTALLNIFKAFIIGYMYGQKHLEESVVMNDFFKKL